MEIGHELVERRIAASSPLAVRSQCSNRRRLYGSTKMYRIRFLGRLGDDPNSANTASAPRFQARMSQRRPVT
jgi:hypothetical protein